MRSRFLASGRHALVRGVGMILIGIVFLLVNLGLLQSVLFRRWWPLLLIIAGVMNLFFYFRRGHRGERPYTDFA